MRSVSTRRPTPLRRRSASKSSASASASASKSASASASKDEPIVIYVINCHGSYSFDSANEPKYVNVPENIKHIDKLTYASFGATNVMNHEEDVNVIEVLKRKLPALYNDKKTYPSGLELSRNIDKMDIVETPAYKLQNDEKTGDLSNARYRSRLHLLLRNKARNKVLTYHKDDAAKIKIINKSYATDSTDKYLNIYVVLEKGGSLVAGKKVLNSDTMRKYMNNPKERCDTIDTNGLLDFSSKHGYQRVVIVDYTCDRCFSAYGHPVPRNIVMSIGDSIRRGVVGRGGRKTMRRRQRQFI